MNSDSEVLCTVLHNGLYSSFVENIQATCDFYDKNIIFLHWDKERPLPPWEYRIIGIHSHTHWASSPSWSMPSVLNGQKGTPVHSLYYLCLTVVTLMTPLNNVHASSPWLLTVAPLAHIVALSPPSSLPHFTLLFLSRYVHTQTHKYLHTVHNILCIYILCNNLIKLTVLLCFVHAT